MFRELKSVTHVALTGGIASGKSTVAARLAALGAVVIDADVLAREVVQAGTPGLQAVVERFGSDVLRGSALDRTALGALVFADDEARRDLEQIIHPAVRELAAERARSARADAVVVQVIPLLVETGQADHFDLCVVVDVSPELQLSRLLARSELSEAQAAARIASQASRDQRLAVADVVLDNNGDRDHLMAQVDALWARLGPLDEHNGRASPKES